MLQSASSKGGDVDNNEQLAKEEEQAKAKDKIRRSQMLELIANFSKEEYGRLKDEFIQSFDNNQFFQKLYDANGFEDGIIQHQRCKFVEIKKAEEVTPNSPAKD